MGVRGFKTKVFQFFGRKPSQTFLLVFFLVCVGIIVFSRVPEGYLSKVVKRTVIGNLNNQFQIQNNPIQIQNKNEEARLELTDTTGFGTLLPFGESFNLTSKAAENATREMVREGSKDILNLPSVPYILGGVKDGPQHVNKSCARFPTVFDIKFSNIYWQTLEASNWTLHALGAYLDVRELNSNAPSIRIVGTIDRIGPNITSYCQIWFENESAPVIAEVNGYYYIWVSKWGNYRDGEWSPYLLNCNIPKSHADKVPTSVSIVENGCDNSSINLRVVFDKPEKKEKIAICVKGMDFPEDDLSIRLIEWIELNYILGVSQIYLYQLANSPETMKVMDYYKKLGKIEVVNTSIPAFLPNEPLLRHAFLRKKMNVKRQTELLPYNDCFYRNMYKYEYIIVVDIDEVFMPKQHADWAELIKHLETKSLEAKKGGHSSFVFHNVFFFHNPADQDEAHFEDIPKEYTMLQHVRRTKYNYTKQGFYIKCMHNTEKILTLHNHFPRACLAGCASYFVDKDTAQMNHYKPTCFSEKKCVEQFKNNSVLDTSIWKFKDELVKRVNNVVQELQLLPVPHSHE